MAYYRRSRQRTRSRRFVPKRKNVWVRQLDTSTTSSPPGERWSFPLTPAAYIDAGAVVGATVVRVRSTIIVGSGPLTDSGAFIVVGIGVFDYAETPDPVDDANKADWLYWDVIPIARMDFGQFSPSPGTSWTFSVPIDAKASRVIVAPQMVPWLIVRISNWASTPPPDMRLASSTLLKLS